VDTRDNCRPYADSHSDRTADLESAECATSTFRRPGPSNLRASAHHTSRMIAEAAGVRVPVPPGPAETTLGPRFRGDDVDRR
jgi:hypothetical protein